MSDETTTATVTFRFGFVGAAIYLAIGMLYHLLMSDGPWLWSDPWTYIHMGLWPFFVFFWIAVTGCVIAAIAFVWMYFEDKKNVRARRKRREEFEREREERRRAIAKATPSDRAGADY